jgi:hypothetical protein
MAAQDVKPPFPIFSGRDGRPLEAGFIFIGEPNENPEDEEQEKAVFWDQALTIPAALPIRTIGGYPARFGSPSPVFTDGDYSLTVRDKNMVLVYTSPNAPITAGQFFGDFSGTFAGTVVGNLKDVPTLLADETLTYTAGQISTVTAGDIVRTRAEGFSYEVAASDATDHHVTTAGGVKLYVVPKNGVWFFDAFAPAKDDATDDGGKLRAAIDAAAAAGGGRVVCSSGTYLITSYVPMKSNVTLEGESGTVWHTNYPTVSGAERIVKSAGFAFNGVSADDDYTTFNQSTGDYFTASPRAFAASTEITAGDTSFDAALVGDLSDVSAGDWLYLSEGIAYWHPSKSEFIQVASVVGTTITTKTRIRNSYSNTATSLGAFIRSYDLVVSPGGGGAGYPDMSTWEDAGFRKVTPVENAAIRGGKIKVTRTGGVSEIGFIFHIAVGCEANVEIENGTFWNIDSQDLTVRVRGGRPSGGSSYLGNGCNGVICDVDVVNQIALEEGAQNVRGKITSIGFNTIKGYVADCDLNWKATAGATPGIECSFLRNVRLTPSVTAVNAGVSNVTPDLATLATDLPQAFLSGEVASYFGPGLILDGGRVASTGNPAQSIEVSGSGQIRCIDTEVPVLPTGRFKGTVVVDGRQRLPVVADAPLFADLEAGETFLSNTAGLVSVAGWRETTISQQFNFGSGTLNTLIITGYATDWEPRVGDIIVFRVSDSAAAPVNWSWKVAEITKTRAASSAIEYSPANDAMRTAITAADEDKIFIFRVGSQFSKPLLKTEGSSFDSATGGFITGIGRTNGAPLQLGNYHLWVDTTGDLRIKNGAPTSDTDGVVVGTQT